MRSDDALTSEFETERPRLRQVAYRMLGSLDEADDALQQAWLRASSADRDDVANPAGWLTTLTARVCLDLLRARRRRAERPLSAMGSPGSAAAAGVQRSSRSGAAGGPPPVGDADGGLRPAAGPRPDQADTGRRRAPVDGARLRRPDAGPDEAAVLAESVGLALLVVLDRLTPAQRVAFVLHDLFAVPFDEVALAVDRSTVATKKLASRARERVRGASDATTPVPLAHRKVVEAFLAASQEGDLATLLDVLAPGVVRRADAFAVPAGTAPVVRGAAAVAEETKVFAARARTAEVALVDGAAGIVVAPAGRLLAVLRVVVTGGRITEVDVVGDPARLATMQIAVLPPPPVR